MTAILEYMVEWRRQLALFPKTNVSKKKRRMKTDQAVTDKYGRAKRPSSTKRKFPELKRPKKRNSRVRKE